MTHSLILIWFGPTNHNAPFLYDLNISSRIEPRLLRFTIHLEKIIFEQRKKCFKYYTTEKIELINNLYV